MHNAVDSGREGGQRPSRPRSPAAVLAGILVLAAAVISACAAPGPSPDASAEARAMVPTPTVGLLASDSVSEGVDGRVPFVEFRSAEAPAGARATYEQTLRGAGFQELRRKDAWTAWGTDRVTVWVSVSRTGPPTSIVVRYAPGVADATMLATAGAEGSPLAPSAIAGDPGASPSPLITAADPATPLPATRPGGPFATPSVPGNGPTAQPTKQPATASPEPTSKPAATPKPTRTPKPSATPKATKKPHPTPKPTKTPKPAKSPKPTPPGKGNTP
jgi:hypothetical protein